MAGEPPPKRLSVPLERTTEDGDRPKRARRTALTPSSPAIPSEPLDEPRPRLTEAEERAAKSIITKSDADAAPVDPTLDPPILRSNDRVENHVVATCVRCGHAFRRERGQ